MFSKQRQLYDFYGGFLYKKMATQINEKQEGCFFGIGQLDVFQAREYEELVF